MSLPSSSTRRPSFPPHSSEHDALEVGLLFVSGIGDGDGDDASAPELHIQLTLGAEEQRSTARRAEGLAWAWEPPELFRLALPAAAVPPLGVHVRSGASALGAGEFELSRSRFAFRGRFEASVPLDRGGFVRLRFRWLVGDATAATRVQASARRRRAAAAVQNLREPPVDARVEGKVEALNTAIDRVNELEDVKAAAEAASRRAEAVIRAELDALYQQNKQSLVGLAPFHEARQAAVEALARAKAADERYAAALGEVEMAEEALQAVVPPGDTPPRGEGAKGVGPIEALFESHLRTKGFGGGGGGSGGERRGSAERQVESHLRARLSAAVKRAGEARKAAKKEREAAVKATRRLGRVGEALQRDGTAVSAHLESEAEYERQRAGLEAVRQAAEARLVAMEGEKARAVDMVGEAMESLEVLSNELHEAGQGGGGGGGGEGGSERPRADSTSVVETQHL